MTEITTGIVLLALAKPIVGYRLGTIVPILAPAAAAAAASVGLATVVTLSRVIGSPVALPTTITALGLLVALALSLVVSYLILITLAVLDRSLVSVLIAKLARRS